MTRTRPTVRALIVALVFCAACDCEERLRRTISNPGDRKAPDAASKPSGPSEHEPNDTAADATAITIGNELRPITGEVALPEDVDWFGLAVSGEPGSFEVMVEPDTGLDVSLHVDVPDGAPLTYDSGRRGDPERIPVFRVGTAPQHFAIRSESNSTGSYTIRFKRHLGSGLEAEPNDETNVATEFGIPSEIQGYYDRPDDRDVYRLEGPTDTAFVLEVAPIEGVRQIARVFEDATLKVPRLTVQVSDETVRIPNLALSEEATRWVVLTPLARGNAERPYRLRAIAHPPMEETLELEPNDEKGMVVEELPATYAGYLHTADDRDRFVLPAAEEEPGEEDEPVEEPEPPATGSDADAGAAAEVDLLEPFRGKPARRSVAATLTWDDADSDLGLRWIAAEDDREFRRTGNRRTVRACGLPLGAEPGSLEVRAASLNTEPEVGTPTYSVAIAVNDSSQGWEAEPNDARADADVVEIGSKRSGAIATSEDVDRFVFAVDAPEGSTRPVAVSVSGQGVDLVMRIVDDGGGVVANVDKGALGAGEKLRLDLPSGVYEVEVRWKGGEFCAPYEVEVR